jgi:hypothetical protein
MWSARSSLYFFSVIVRVTEIFAVLLLAAEWLTGLESGQPQQNVSSDAHVEGASKDSSFTVALSAVEIANISNY